MKEVLAACAPGLRRLEVRRSEDEVEVDLNALNALTPCAALQHLHLCGLEARNLGALAALPALQHLQHLHLEALHGMPDLSVLASLTTLQHLQLDWCTWFEPNALSALTALRHLHINTGSNVKDLGVLVACVSLQSLRIGHYTSLANVDALAACTDLRHLSLRDCSDRLSDIGVLAACTALQSVELIGCKGLSDLLQSLAVSSSSAVTHLGTHPALQHLRIVDCKQVRGKYPALRYLDIGGSKGYMGSLAGCITIQRLNMQRCYNVRALIAMPALQHLDMCSCTGVTDIGVLAACTALRHLDRCFVLSQ